MNLQYITIGRVDHRAEMRFIIKPGRQCRNDETSRMNRLAEVAQPSAVSVEIFLRAIVIELEFLQVDSVGPRFVKKRTRHRGNRAQIRIVR